MTPSSHGSGVQITDETRKAFPDHIALILGSESMNDEERQYWINILPVMTPEQLENLRGILENEKNQLAEIDRKYSSQVDMQAAKAQVQETAEQIRERREERHAKELTAEEQEAFHTEELLKKIEQL